MTDNFRDPWVLLEVDRNASDKEIQKSYRLLAYKYHPDRNPGDKTAGKILADINSAYDSIRNESQRSKWLAEHEGVHSPDGSFREESFPDLGDDSPRGVKIIEKAITIDFKQAFEGAQLQLEVEVDDVCSMCGGSGAAPGDRPKICQVCGGNGQIQIGKMTHTCRFCKGKGHTVGEECPRCQNGIISEVRPYVLQIPPGITNGHRLRVPSQGRGRTNTDLLVTIKIEESPVFQRNLPDKSDLLIEVPISYSEACFGGSIKLPTPSKVIALKVPPGTKSGKAFRISGQGMPRFSENNPSNLRGDLYARVQVEIPDKLSSPQKKLVQQLAHYDEDSIRSRLFQN